jgi:hypothetical protein
MSIKEQIQRENKAKAILVGLKNEIDETVIWLLESDLNIYGEIRQGAVDAAKMQGTPIPKALVEYIAK